MPARKQTKKPVAKKKAKSVAKKKVVATKKAARPAAKKKTAVAKKKATKPVAKKKVAAKRPTPASELPTPPPPPPTPSSAPTPPPPGPRPTPPPPPGPTLEALLGHIRQRRGLPIPPNPLDEALLHEVTAQTGLQPAEDLVLAWTWLSDRDVFSPELLISATQAARARTSKPELVAVRGEGEAFVVIDQSRGGETWLVDLHGFNTGASSSLSSWLARQYLSAEERHALGFPA